MLASVETLSVTVDVFSADMDCATAQVEQITQGFYGGLTDNPLIDDISFTVTTDGDARNVYLAATDESNCTGLVAKVRQGHTWAYNGSYCEEQQTAGADSNRLVFVSGTWNGESTRTFTVQGSATSTAGLIPGTLLAGKSSTATRVTSSTTGFSTASFSSAQSASSSTSGNDIQLDDPTVVSNDVFIQTVPRSSSTLSNDVFIQTVAKTTSSSPSSTSTSENDIQLGDPVNDISAAVIAKRADGSPSSTTGTATGTPTFYVLPTTVYTPSVAFICKPRYSIRKANVTLSKNASDADINTNTASSNSGLAFANMTLLKGDDADERQLDAFSAWKIMSPVFMAMELSDAELMNGGLLSFMNSMAPEVPEGGDEQDRLIEGLRQTFRSISAQVASTYLTRSLTSQNSTDEKQNRTLSGSTVAHETRLAMQAPAFWVTEIALLIAVFSTSYLMLNSPDMRVSRDPGTIGGLATILARSKRVMQLLAGTGTLPLKRIKDDALGPDREFGAGVLRPANGSAAKWEFLIEVENENERQIRESQELQRRESFNDPPEWYRPFAVSILGNILIASVPLVLIVVLEILYQYSARHDGLADVDDANLYAHYAWTFIPTLIMVGVGQLFGMLDFATKVFAPYSALCRSGGAPARTSIMASYLDKLGVHALYAALAKKQWAVAAAAVATVLSPLLTIVTSGLLNAEAAPANYTVAVTQLDAFTGNQSLDGDGIVAANLVLANNLTYPQWTYDTIAIPRFEAAAEQASASLTTLARNASSLRATVPAVRGVANCTVAAAPLEAFRNCSSQWLDLYLLTAGDEFSPQSTSNFDGDGYFGWWQAPWFDNGADDDDRRPPGCPPIISSFGRVAGGNVSEVTHLSCTPYVESVRANVSLALPDYRILVDAQHAPEAPPVIGGGDFFSDEFWAFSAAGKGGYKLTNPNPRNETDEDLAALYGLVVWGPDGVPKEELVGGDGAEERLVRRVEKVYAQVLAQILHKEREWVNNGTTTTTTTAAAAGASKTKRDDGGLTGTITYEARTRLKQSPISTRILEGLLAAMFLCAALTFALLDTRQVLPKNPCSIAAVASLLAGSSLLASIPEGAEWMSEKQLRDKGVFEDTVFSMGWWGGDESSGSDGERRSTSVGTGRRFGIDVGSAMDEKGGANESADANEEKKDWRPKWWKRIWP